MPFFFLFHFGLSPPIPAFPNPEGVAFFGGLFNCAEPPNWPLASGFFLGF